MLLCRLVKDWLVEHASWQLRSELLSDVHPGRITAQNVPESAVMQWLPQESEMRGFRAKSTSLNEGSRQQCQQTLYDSAEIYL